ncbi:hypothetical protein Pla123a_27660 [Posidoniimonas polymericola]|uniref:Uncharacterized protein n=1 Tax=Posidoniimonas polymericola TaxID=2528002 RepID=A0A5C5YMC7_9BACT|nr:hypothetical protein [Posidoniimonas polymericola]TWT75980.1 hypothetical protein Pla123a_27660 [Posidoniimonas polymericola]
MKLLQRSTVTLALLVGVGALIWLSVENNTLGKQITQLEAELGHMPIGDPDRVHIAEIGSPEVPPEVASQLERVWQFRCYLPAGYDMRRFGGEGRVAESGLYFQGGFGSGSESPQAEAIQQLLTVSFYRDGDHLKVYNAFGGSSGTSSWPGFAPERLDEALVVHKLVNKEQGPQSFPTDAILPFLKIYDPSSAEERNVAGKPLTTYDGGMFAIFPGSREQAFGQLRRGETPDGFEAHWVAEGTAQ